MALRLTNALRSAIASSRPTKLGSAVAAIAWFAGMWSLSSSVRSKDSKQRAIVRLSDPRQSRTFFTVSGSSPVNSPSRSSVYLPPAFSSASCDLSLSRSFFNPSVVRIRARFRLGEFMAEG
ncbi:MAG: hypothetical protein KME16_22000 [Scytolyngbya sp. HA4215-MV1]|nr:hypothetical protein [Scytolyngbya sp. HA4215-MV1]